MDFRIELLRCQHVEPTLEREGQNPALASLLYLQLRTGRAGQRIEESLDKRCRDYLFLGFLLRRKLAPVLLLAFGAKVLYREHGDIICLRKVARKLVHAGLHVHAGFLGRFSGTLRQRNLETPPAEHLLGRIHRLGNAIVVEEQQVTRRQLQRLRLIAGIPHRRKHQARLVLHEFHGTILVANGRRPMPRRRKVHMPVAQVQNANPYRHEHVGAVVVRQIAVSLVQHVNHRLAVSRLDAKHNAGNHHEQGRRNTAPRNVGQEEHNPVVVNLEKVVVVATHFPHGHQERGKRMPAVGAAFFPFALGQESQLYTAGQVQFTLGAVKLHLVVHERLERAAHLREGARKFRKFVFAAHYGHFRLKIPTANLLGGSGKALQRARNAEGNRENQQQHDDVPANADPHEDMPHGTALLEERLCGPHHQEGPVDRFHRGKVDGRLLAVKRRTQEKPALHAAQRVLEFGIALVRRVP